MTFGKISRCTYVPSYANALYKTVFDDFKELFERITGLTIDKIMVVGSRAIGLADVSSRLEVFVSFGEFR